MLNANGHHFLHCISSGPAGLETVSISLGKVKQRWHRVYTQGTYKGYITAAVDSQMETLQ